MEIPGSPRLSRAGENNAASRARGQRSQGSLYRGGTKAERFKSTVANGNGLAASPSTTPGPGSYPPPDYWQSVDRVALRQMELERAENAPVRWMRVPTAPSIPGREQSYGYEEGANGELVQQKPVERGHT